MPDYTSLNGVENSQKSTLSNILLNNFTSFYDWGFLDKGGYYNVKLNNLDIYNANKSVLKPIKIDGRANGSVWQTYRKNLVWESGVSKGAPINISGVYVNNTFHSTGNITRPFNIDYRNGTVNFASGIPLNSVVKMEYSHKYIDVVEADGVPFFREIQKDSFRADSPQFSLHGSGTWANIGQTRVQMPTVAINVSCPVDFAPFELGSHKQYVDNEVTFYVLTEKSWECKNIMDQISFQNDRNIYLYDTNKIAQSGAFPFDSNNYLAPNATSNSLYPHLVDNYRYGHCYIKESKCRPIVELNQGLYIGTVKCRTEVIEI